MTGDWLHGIARVLFDDSIVSSVVQPTIADLQQEVQEAGTRGAILLAHLRGYAAFWSIVLMSPFVFRNWPGRRQHARSTALLLLIGTVFLALLAGQQAMREWLGWALDEISDSSMATLAAAATMAFLAGPIAFTFVAMRLRTAPHPTGVATVLVMFSLLSATAGAVLGTAAVINTFAPIGSQGSASFAVLGPSVVGAGQSMLYASVAMTVCLAVAAAWSLRRERRMESTLVAMTKTQAIGLSLVLVVAVVAIDQLLRFQHELMYWLIVILGPPVPGSGLRAAQGSEVGIPLFFLGLAFTLLLLLAGIVIWRSSRGLAPHPIFVWSSRAVAGCALAVSIWHLAAINSNVNTLRDEIEAARQRPPLVR
jgi:hypothetical protein